MEHHRAFPRQTVRLEALLRASSAGPRARDGEAEAVETESQEGAEQRARLENLGLGGASVVVDGSAPDGEILELVIDGDELWEPLVLRARPAWRRSDGTQTDLGLAFLGDDAMALVSLLVLLHLVDGAPL